MKKSSLLISTLAITTIAGVIFAQTGGATTVLTMVEKMKAASHDFTLTSELNAGQTGLKSGPLIGKKTGEMVTAEEYNRILEMLSESGNGGSAAELECVTRDISGSGSATVECPSGYVRTGGGVWTQYCPGCGVVSAPSGTNAWMSSTLPGNTGTNNHAYVNCCKIKGDTGSGGTGGATNAGWVDVLLTDTDAYDENCLYRIKTSGASGASVRYSVGVGTDSVMFGWNIITGWIGGYVAKADKSHFIVQGQGQHNEYIISKMEKKCEGSISGTTNTTTGTSTTTDTTTTQTTATSYRWVANTAPSSVVQATPVDTSCDGGEFVAAIRNNEKIYTNYSVNMGSLSTPWSINRTLSDIYCGKFNAGTAAASSYRWVANTAGASTASTTTIQTSCNGGEFIAAIRDREATFSSVIGNYNRTVTDIYCGTFVHSTTGSNTCRWVANAVASTTQPGTGMQTSCDSGEYAAAVLNREVGVSYNYGTYTRTATDLYCCKLGN